MYAYQWTLFKIVEIILLWQNEGSVHNVKLSLYDGEGWCGPSRPPGRENMAGEPPLSLRGEEKKAGGRVEKIW